jgi:hypothetical protein
MATNSKTALKREFLNDHRRMTRLLRDVVENLENGDIEAGRSLADELDQVAGPHIAFEETILYPAVGSAEGVAFQQKLLAEHDQAREGLAQMLAADQSQLDDVAYRNGVLAALHTGLKHAESCGTLVSHLEEMTDDQQRQALSRLKELRQIGSRWTARSR